jgi:hypothetical protein
MPLKSSFCYPLALATVATATLAGAASAATFNLSYTSSAGTITATVEGTLQPDNNTVFVSSISNPIFNGSPAPALPFLGTFDPPNIPPSGQAVLSLDGSVLNFLACTDVFCSDGFLLDPTIFSSGFSYGGIAGEPIDLANYSLTPATPEPATVLGLLSVAGVGFLSKRQKSAK